MYKRTRKSGKTGLTIVSLISIFLLPIYPTFSSFVSNGNELEFYRGDIDESSIISSYIGEDEELTVEGEGDVFIQSKDSYLQVSAELDEDKKDGSYTKEVIEHTVQKDETFASIAEEYSISEKSIYLANDFNTEHKISEGDILKLPPVTGMLHTVRSGDTLSGISKSYGIDSEEIMRQNFLLSSEDLTIGKTIIIPGAERDIPKPPAPKPTYVASSPATGSSGTAASQFVSPAGRYKLVWRSPYSGAPGNCTWYVASYKNVNWRGNANQWMRNAAAKGHAIGYTARTGAIVQFAGLGYNPYYGHVGIVVDVTNTHIIVSDMNYRAKYEVTTRKVPINDRSIQGYIYVN
ncbi:LysM peptidoglycan-binding domain-containing protein [Candidatus Gracilibacteria bacterium]|nr:LysM peptidoglycan-binding domain-containing protein [Candidatus Gracilibacteria bacterium]